MQLDPREMELLRMARVSDDDIIRIVKKAIDTRVIVPPTVRLQTTNAAGGTNFCPNSDFAFSHLAATVANTLPGDAGATNLEVYRVFRQEVEANIGTQRVRTVEADAWIPLWDRVQGTIQLGWDGGSGANYDIAIQFTNNWLSNNRRRYVRVAVATADDTPVPVGTKLFAGYWLKRTGGSQGWADGSNFELDYSVPVEGTTNYKYKVVAKTDTGFEMISAELDVPNAPDAISADNHVKITYAGASGFIEFKTYRKDVATGVVYLVAWDRQSERLHAYDTGTTIGAPLDDFPTVDVSVYRAYQEVPIDAVSIDVQKTFHNMTIRVPANLDNSDVAVEGTYLRIGVKGNTASNLQVVIDTIWESSTYNVWSPSPFDNYPSPPSTTMTTAPPTGGSGGGDPPGGGSTCVWVEHDLFLGDDRWLRVGKAPNDAGLVVDNGSSSPNTIKHFIDGRESHYYNVVFDCGLFLFCSPSQRFARSLRDASGIIVDLLKRGDKVIGGRHGAAKLLTIESVELVTTQTQLDVRSPVMTENSYNRLYAVGDSETGWYVYLHNLKPVDP